MEQKLMEWFDKTGYPLELFAESILSKCQYKTTSSAIYHDQENELFRELDLETERSWTNSSKDITLLITLLIECKKSEKPFILLSNKNPIAKQLSIGSYNFFDHPNFTLVFDNPYQVLKLPDQSSSGFKMIQGFINSDETSHKIENTLIKSFNDFLKRESELRLSYAENNTNTITFPVLIIDAPFFELKIDENDEMKLRKIDTGILNCLTHLRQPYPTEFPIAVIKKESFGNFLSVVNQFAEQNLQFLIDHPNCNIKNFEKYELTIYDIEKTEKKE